MWIFYLESVRIFTNRAWLEVSFLQNQRNLKNFFARELGNFCHKETQETQKSLWQTV